jgi:predicted outer membrane repeat protein
VTIRIRKLLCVFAVFAIAILPASTSQAAGEDWRFKNNLPARIHSTAYSSTAAGIVIDVPGQVNSLQTAINQVSDGGVIELETGIYSSPSGGFSINNLQKGFTIRAAEDAQVTLSGGNSHEVLRFVNSNSSLGKPVTFQDLKFASGYTNVAGIAAGVSLSYAEATFVRCTFQGNSSGPSANAGGVFLGAQSRALFVDSVWRDNTANNTGGGLRLDDSKAYIYNSQFINNRTNLPFHTQTSSGGAISVLNSTLRLADTRFDGNQAGYAGGAIFVLGSWLSPWTSPRSHVLIANSTFVDNLAQRDPSVSFNAPTEGGAIHVEAQSLVKIYHSRFITNRAMSGGAITLNRSTVEVDNSIFRGNRAIGTDTGGYGGAISANSIDVSSDGSNNYPSISLTVQNSLFQGRYGDVSTVAQGGGGIYAGGDLTRTYGLNGVSKIGSLADNRGRVVVNNVVFYDLDVEKANLGGFGGSIYSDLIDLTMQNSLIAGCDASGGAYSSGGGLAIINQSLGNVSESVFAQNTSSGYGGGVFAQGVTINLNDSTLIENSTIGTNYGSAIFTAPFQYMNIDIPVTGVIQRNLISNHETMTIFDDDRTKGPINDVRYDNNTFYRNTGEDPIVYNNPINPYGYKKVSELNQLTIIRANGTLTVKSEVPNTSLTDLPNIGKLFAAPGAILPKTAYGDPETSSPAFLAYAWSGISAALDQASLSTNIGIQTTSSTGNHILSVGTTQYPSTIIQREQLTTSFTSTMANGTTTLSWSVPPSTFLDNMIDQGVSAPWSPSGTVQVTSLQEKTYYLYAITQAGGTVKSTYTGLPVLNAPSSIKVLAGHKPPYNRSFVTITRGGGGVLVWTAQTSTPDLITLENTQGETESSSTIFFAIHTTELPVGQYIAAMQIDAGESGSQDVAILIVLIDPIEEGYLPFIIR